MSKIHHWPVDPPSYHLAKPIWDKYLLWCGASVSHPNYKWTADIGKVTCRRCQDRIARDSSAPSKTYLPVKII